MDEKSLKFSLIWNTGCASEMKASGGSQLTDAERADFAALTERRGIPDTLYWKPQYSLSDT